MRRIALAVLFLVAVSGCALRPRYRDFVSDTTAGKDVKLVLAETDNAHALAGVKVEMSEWRNKYTVTTAPDGTFVVPVEKKYLDENPVLVVTLPMGITGYDIRVAPAPTPEGAPVAPAAVPAPNN